MGSLSIGWLIGTCFWLISGCVATAHSATATGAACVTVESPALSELDNTLRIDEFAIHYTSHGRHAIQDLTDRDGNKQPDLIDDLALQLTTARILYGQSFGLQHPLDQPRYAKAKHINVFVLALEKGNGLAFDEVVGERIGLQTMPCALRLFVSNKLRFSSNVTAAHELFHLYQYGYSMFKSRWYLEGMARWVELAFRDRTAQEERSAQNVHWACDDVYGSTYTASTYWAQQARSFAAQATVVPDTIRSRRYSDGSRVVRETGLPGKQLILHALRGLATASAAVSEAENLPLYRWPEKIQTSSRFDPLICDTISHLAHSGLNR